MTVPMSRWRPDMRLLSLRRWRLWRFLAVLLTVVGIGVFLVTRPTDGPPPGYDQLKVGMTSNEVRATLRANPIVAGDSETYFPERGNVGGVVYITYGNGVVRSIGIQHP